MCDKWTVNLMLKTRIKVISFTISVTIVIIIIAIIIKM